MAEYIKREKALNDFDEWIETTGALPKGTSYYHECRACIEDVPAADVVEVVHGEWLGWGKGGMPLYENYGTCSVCHEDAEICTEHRNFCPNCGAKMDANSKTTLPETTRQTVLDTFMKGSEN